MAPNDPSPSFKVNKYTVRGNSFLLSFFPPISGDKKENKKLLPLTVYLLTLNDGYRFYKQF